MKHLQISWGSKSKDGTVESLSVKFIVSSPTSKRAISSKLKDVSKNWRHQTICRLLASFGTEVVDSQCNSY